MTKKLVWRLSKLPGVEELRGLVGDKIITQEEAREILFKTETEEERDKESLKSEIQFLRLLVEKLSTTKTIIEQIRYIDKPYQGLQWYVPYSNWCATTATNTISNTLTLQNGSATQLTNTLPNALSANVTSGSSSYSGFSNIKSF